MAEIILLGGFASTNSQVNATALELSDHLNKDVQGFNFSSGRDQDPRFFDEKIIYTHSGGILAAENSHPSELTIVAPPVPEAVAALLWRGWFMGRKLRQAEESEKGFTDTSTYEALRHPGKNFGSMPEISRFNSFLSAIHHRSNGANVTMALMRSDGLFNYDTEETMDDIMQAKAHGVNVVSVTGEHVRFTNKPREVMAEIALGRSVQLGPLVLPDLRQRFSTAA